MKAIKALQAQLASLDNRIARITMQAEEKLRPLREERSALVQALEILNAGTVTSSHVPAAGEASTRKDEARPETDASHTSPAQQMKVAAKSAIRKDDAPPAFLKRAE